MNDVGREAYCVLRKDCMTNGLTQHVSRGVRQSFASAIIHALPLPPRHKDTKTRRHEAYKVGQAREPARRAYLQSQPGHWRFLFLPRIFTENSERIDENLWKSVQSVAEYAVSYGQNDFRQTPVPTSKHLTWLFFVPSCLRGLFERVAAQKNDTHPQVGVDTEKRSANYHKESPPLPVQGCKGGSQMLAGASSPLRM